MSENQRKAELLICIKLSKVFSKYGIKIRMGDFNEKDNS